MGEIIRKLNAEKSDETLSVTDNIVREQYGIGIFNKEILFTENVKMINDYAFFSNSHIENVIISKGVKSIGRFAFSECENLKNIVIPDSVNYIGDYAFDGCKALESIVIPDSITALSPFTFKGCKNLKTITLPNHMEFVATGAFINSGIEKIILSKERIFELIIANKNMYNIRIVYQ